MKRIFEIESASGVRVDRDIVLAQLNSAAFDGCFSVKDITDDHADKNPRHTTYEIEIEREPDSIVPNLNEIRQALVHHFVNLKITRVGYGADTPYSQPPKGSEISEAWDVFMEKASAEMAVMGDALDSKMRRLGRALLYRLNHPE